jgi:hypothetical protein
MKYKSRYVGTGANGSAVYVVEDENGDRQVRPGSKAHGSKLFSAQEASAFIQAHDPEGVKAAERSAAERGQ